MSRPRAAGRSAPRPGEPYKDRLLKLPGFLIGQTRANRPREEEIRAGFALTDFFLHQNVFEPQGQRAPEERARFVALATAGDE